MNALSAAAAAECGGGAGCCCCCSIFALSSARIISSEAEGDMAEADEADTAASRGDVGEGARPCCFRILKGRISSINYHYKPVDIAMLLSQNSYEDFGEEEDEEGKKE